MVLVRGLPTDSAFLRAIFDEAEGGRPQAYEPVIADEAEGESAVIRELFG